MPVENLNRRAPGRAGPHPYRISRSAANRVPMRQAWIQYPLFTTFIQETARPCRRIIPADCAWTGAWRHGILQKPRRDSSDATVMHRRAQPRKAPVRMRTKPGDRWQVATPGNMRGTGGSRPRAMAATRPTGREKRNRRKKSGGGASRYCSPRGGNCQECGTWAQGPKNYSMGAGPAGTPLAVVSTVQPGSSPWRVGGPRNAWPRPCRLPPCDRPLRHGGTAAARPP